MRLPLLRHYSLRTQLSFWFGGLTLLTLTGVGIYVGRVATGELARSSGEALYITANAAADLLGSHLREREQEIDLLRHSPLFTRGALDSTEVRAALDLRLRIHAAYAWLGVADSQGKVLQASDGLLLGADVAQRPWFLQARQQVFTGDVHEAVLLAKLLPGHDDEPLRFIDFAAPIHDDRGQLRGVLGAHAHWRWVTETVASVVQRHMSDRELEFLITDSAGNVLYPQALAGELQLPPAPAQAAHYAVERWPDGLDYLSTRVRLPRTTTAPLDWWIVLRQPAEQALAPVRALRQQLITLGLFASLLFAALARHFARNISAPIEQLADAARQIEQGGTPVLSPATERVREVRALHTAFESMTRTLLRHESELEAQVADRTRELEAANTALAQLATRDALTGAFNRRHLDSSLQAQFSVWRRHGRPFALIMVDADHFKQVNDRHGHPTGDAVLRQLAQLMQQQIRSSDTLARYGGEEFALLLPDSTFEDAANVAEKIRRSVAESHFGEAGKLTVSLGLSGICGEDEDTDTLVSRADEALYLAKQNGRNRVEARPPTAAPRCPP